MNEFEKRILFFFERFDIERFRRDYDIPLTVSAKIEEYALSKTLWLYGQDSLSEYVNAFLVPRNENLRDKTNTELLIEQGYRPQEVTLWAQFYDSDGDPIKYGHVNQIPISSMSTNHIRACLRGRPENFNNQNLLKEELKYRGKG